MQFPSTVAPTGEVATKLDCSPAGWHTDGMPSDKTSASQKHFAHCNSTTLHMIEMRSVTQAPYQTMHERLAAKPSKKTIAQRSHVTRDLSSNTTRNSQTKHMWTDEKNGRKGGTRIRKERTPMGNSADPNSASGLQKSGYTDVPGQHQPSYSPFPCFFVNISLSLNVW